MMRDAVTKFLQFRQSPMKIPRTVSAQSRKSEDDCLVPQPPLFRVAIRRGPWNQRHPRTEAQLRDDVIVTWASGLPHPRPRFRAFTGYQRAKWRGSHIGHRPEWTGCSTLDEALLPLLSVPRSKLAVDRFSKSTLDVPEHFEDCCGHLAVPRVERLGIGPCPGRLGGVRPPPWG